MDAYCGAWWCNKVIKQPCKVGGTVVCRNCYQHIWSEAKKAGESMTAIFLKVRPPYKTPERLHIQCSRANCDVILTPETDPIEYRWIDKNTPVCRNCYETTWEQKKKLGLKSMKEAFDQLYPKGHKPPRAEPAKCVMPWCKNCVTKNKGNLLEEGRYVCGECRLYLRVLQRRHKSNQDWKHYAQKAIQGEIPAPGTPRYCCAKWCNVKVSDQGGLGPNGEALCNADRTYFYYYARRHGITFKEAFTKAPPPRGVSKRKD